MSDITIRPAHIDDLARLTEIYNHYIINTPITFDLEPYAADERRGWLAEFDERGRHRLLVAEDGGVVAGYAGTHEFRTKKAYDTTVETTIYLAQGFERRGIGTRLYESLFATVAGEDIHTMIAGITLPNEASVALHERFGFVSVGVMPEVGRKFDRYWDVGWYQRPLR